MRRTIALIFAAVCASCSSIIHCNGFDNLAWEPKEMPEGMRFQPYDETIELFGTTDFSVEEFRITGNLPPGLQTDGLLRIHGTPHELGTFHFKLTVKGHYYDESSDTCPDSAERSYTIKIN